MWQETFDIVWRTVKEKHYDPKFNGVDWDKVREAYAPRVAEVKSDQELYALLQQMIGELGQSHFNIIPREAVVEDEEGRAFIGHDRSRGQTRRRSRGDYARRRELARRARGTATRALPSSRSTRRP